MIRTTMLLVLVGLIFTACSGAKYRLTEEGKKVKLLGTLPAGQNCRLIDEVYSMADGSSSELDRILRSARNYMRNQAAVMGGNIAVIETDNSSQTKGEYYLVLSGNAYNCDPTNFVVSTPSPAKKADVTPPVVAPVATKVPPKEEKKDLKDAKDSKDKEVDKDLVPDAAPATP